MGLPVSWFGSVGPESSDPLVRVLAAVSSGFLVVTLAVLRMYLGWAYVGNRLLSATVECNFFFSLFMNFPILFSLFLFVAYAVLFLFVADEETGWYDGQVNW